MTYDSTVLSRWIIDRVDESDILSVKSMCFVNNLLGVSLVCPFSTRVSQLVLEYAGGIMSKWCLVAIIIRKGNTP